METRDTRERRELFTKKPEGMPPHLPIPLCMDAMVSKGEEKGQEKGSVQGNKDAESAKVQKAPKKRGVEKGGDEIELENGPTAKKCRIESKEVSETKAVPKNKVKASSKAEKRNREEDTPMQVQTTLIVTHEQLRGLLVKTDQFQAGLDLLKDPEEEKKTPKEDGKETPNGEEEEETPEGDGKAKGADKKKESPKGKHKGDTKEKPHEDINGKSKENSTGKVGEELEVQKGENESPEKGVGDELNRREKNFYELKKASFEIVNEMRRGIWTRKVDGVSAEEIQEELKEMCLTHGDIIKIARGEGCRDGRVRLETWWKGNQLRVKLAERGREGKKHPKKGCKENRFGGEDRGKGDTAHNAVNQPAMDTHHEWEWKNEDWKTQKDEQKRQFQQNWQKNEGQQIDDGKNWTDNDWKKREDSWNEQFQRQWKGGNNHVPKKGEEWVTVYPTSSWETNTWAEPASCSGNWEWRGQENSWETNARWK